MPSGFKKFINQIGGDHSQVDHQSVENDIAQSVLLPGEHVHMAFKLGRDTTVFTTTRILVIDVHGMSGKRVEHRSLPYGAILTFAAETAGGKLDNDAELVIWSRCPWLNPLKIDFAKKEVDIYAVQVFLASKVLDPRAPAPVPQPGQGGAGDTSNLLNWLGNDAVQVDPGSVERNLRTIAPVLLPDEHVEMAFQLGRDIFTLTTKRLLDVNVKGMSGKRVEFTTIPYTSIGAFAVQSAGGRFDRDAELLVWNKVPVQQHPLQLDLRKGRADLFAIQSCLAAKVLGHAGGAAAPQAPPQSSAAGGGESLMACLGGDGIQVNPQQLEEELRRTVPLLLPNERVEVALKTGRDTTVFTTHRLLMIDVKGLSGKKVEYFTLPYASVQAFAVETAGTWDCDAEWRLWTAVSPPPPPPDNGDGPPPPPPPGKHYLEHDLRKGLADPLALQRHLAARMLRARNVGAALQGLTLEASQPPPAAAKPTSFLDYMGQNASQVNPREVEAQLRAAAPILLDDEHVAFAFKLGRDSTVLTSHRLLIVDVQGRTGKSVEYRSVLYSAVSAFAVRTAGSFDRDVEVTFSTTLAWMPEIEQDLRKDNADLFAIQGWLAAMILEHNTAGPPPRPPQGYSPQSFLAWLGDNAAQASPAEVEAQLRNALPLLLGDESVLMAFKSGRDMTVLTNRRLLRVDRRGMTGKSVEYLSVPYRAIPAFGVQSAGSLSSDSQMRVYTTMGILTKAMLGQDLQKDKADIHAIQRKLMELC